MNDLRELRYALGNFATGVCVVSASIGGGSVGMTINSFSSVSLEPSLVLWSLKRDSASYELFSGIEVFSINVLRADQEDISGRYARYGNHELEKEDYYLSNIGTPLVNDALAYFECRLWSKMEAGDHDIIIGSVMNYCGEKSGEPLLFYRGGYCQLDAVV